MYWNTAFRSNNTLDVVSIETLLHLSDANRCCDHRCTPTKQRHKQGGCIFFPIHLRDENLKHLVSKRHTQEIRHRTIGNDVTIVNVANHDRSWCNDCYCFTVSFVRPFCPLIRLFDNEACLIESNALDYRQETGFRLWCFQRRILKERSLLISSSRSSVYAVSRLGSFFTTGKGVIKLAPDGHHRRHDLVFVMDLVIETSFNARQIARCPFSKKHSLPWKVG